MPSASERERLPLTKEDKIRVLSVLVWMPFLPLFFAAWLVTMTTRHPVALLPIGLLLIVTILKGFRRESRIRLLTLEREHDDIGTFAKSFDRRQTDPWILRAVYEEMSARAMIDKRPFPFRARDDWRKILNFDREDELDMLDDIAFRARRSMEDTEDNPLFDKVHTVADIVHFFEYQPRLPFPLQRDGSAS